MQVYRCSHDARCCLLPTGQRVGLRRCHGVEPPFGVESPALYQSAELSAARAMGGALMTPSPYPVSRLEASILTVVRDWGRQYHAPCPPSVLAVDCVVIPAVLADVVAGLVLRGLLVPAAGGLVADEGIEP